MNLSNYKTIEMITCDDIPNFKHKCGHCQREMKVYCAFHNWYYILKFLSDKDIIKEYKKALPCTYYIEPVIFHYFPHLQNTINKIKLLK